MKKKGKQVRSPTASVRQHAKGKVIEPQSPADVTPTIAPASPSSAWLEMLQQQATVAKETPPSRSVHAGPGLDMIQHELYQRVNAVQPVIVSEAGLCSGCLCQIKTVKDHEWWCPWWDTPQGKVAHPL